MFKIKKQTAALLIALIILAIIVVIMRMNFNKGYEDAGRALDVHATEFFATANAGQ